MELYECLVFDSEQFLHTPQVLKEAAPITQLPHVFLKSILFFAKLLIQNF